MNEKTLENPSDLRRPKTEKVMEVLRFQTSPPAGRSPLPLLRIYESVGQESPDLKFASTEELRAILRDLVGQGLIRVRQGNLISSLDEQIFIDLA